MSKPKRKAKSGEEKWREGWSKYCPVFTLVEQQRFYIPGHRNPFRMDFLHVETKIVVEVSGGVHSIQSVRRRDYMRTRYLLDNGYLVYTFDVGELANKYIEQHVYQIERAIIKKRMEMREYGKTEFQETA